jgi:hypothetical protein
MSLICERRSSWSGREYRESLVVTHRVGGGDAGFILEQELNDGLETVRRRQMQWCPATLLVILI